MKRSVDLMFLVKVVDYFKADLSVMDDDFVTQDLERCEDAEKRLLDMINNLDRKELNDGSRHMGTSWTSVRNPPSRRRDPKQPNSL